MKELKKKKGKVKWYRKESVMSSFILQYGCERWLKINYELSLAQYGRTIGFLFRINYVASVVDGNVLIIYDIS